MNHKIIALISLSMMTLSAQDMIPYTDTQNACPPNNCPTVSQPCYSQPQMKIDCLAQPLVEPSCIPCQTVTKPSCNSCQPILRQNKSMLISVVGQGVAPNNTISPAQAYALAKRAAIADAYRLIAEKVKGVKVEGKDYIKNMIVKRSTVRTYVNAMIRNANIEDTTFKDGLCEVEMDVKLYYSQFAQ